MGERMGSGAWGFPGAQTAAAAPSPQTRLAARAVRRREVREKSPNRRQGGRRARTDGQCAFVAVRAADALHCPGIPTAVKVHGVGDVRRGAQGLLSSYMGAVQLRTLQVCATQ